MLFVKMKLLKLTLLGMLFLGIGLYLGAIWGLKKGAFNAGLEENKIAKGLITNTDLKLSPEFTEYLRGRIYYNIATKYPNDRGYLLRKDWDLGEVEETNLPHKCYAKDPTADYSSFDAATERLSNADE